MATSSITHNFYISGQQSLERFINAIDESEKNSSSTPLDLNGQLLTNQKDIADFMKKLTKNDK